MKIALVSAYDHAHPGGVREHISHLEANFTKMGHQVKIMAPFSYQQPLERNVIPLGRPIFYIPSGGSTARMNIFPRPWSRLKAILKEEEFDIIHIHEPMLPWLPVNTLRLSQTINIGTFHAYHPRSLGYVLWKPYLYRLWFKKLHGIIAVSEAAREFHNRYFPADYTIIPNGIAYKHFSADVAPIEKYCDGKLNVLFVGRIEKRKGLKYLLGAFRRLKGRFPDTRLIVVGPGGRSHRLLGHHNLEGVNFTGYVSYEDLPRYFKTAHVFCAPATGAESFGIVLLEAMAAGAPVVASNIKGYAGLITNGVNGLLAQPMDEESLANAIARLLENKSLREKLIANGKLKSVDYRWESVAEEVMDYYEKIIRRYRR